MYSESGQAIARSLGSDCLESEANSLLVASGFQIEEPEPEEPEIDTRTMLVILRSKLAAIQTGTESAKMKRSEVITGAVYWYTENGEIVTVYESWDVAFRRAQGKANARAIAELNEMISEAEMILEAETALDECREDETEENMEVIRNMFAVNSISAQSAQKRSN